MTRRSCRILAGSSLVVAFVLGTSTSSLADDAKKRELALAKCAATYKTNLQACENLAEAVACYQKADADDLACRSAQGAAGHSDVDPGIAKTRLERITIGPKLPLNCTTGLNPTCADGHARIPICAESSQQSQQNAQGIGGPANTPVVIQDANGNADRCTGQSLRCPAGFTLFPRPGQDLCWDSVENKNRYRY
jgi:hypothetical protein